MNDIKPGMKVKVVKLGAMKGMMIASKHLTIRREGATGTVFDFVPCHGGDVWYVQQDDGIAAYSHRELEPADSLVKEQTQ